MSRESSVAVLNLAEIVIEMERTVPFCVMFVCCVLAEV